MAGFDPRKYRNDVLKPYSKGEGLEQLRDVMAALQRHPQSDAYTQLNLNLLFDVPAPASAANLVDWRKQIDPTLNKAAQQLPAARLLKGLLELLSQQGQDLSNPEWWGRQQAARQQLVIGKLEAGLRQLSAEYPLGVVVREELLSRLNTVGITGITEDSILSMSRQQGLNVVESLDLPTQGVPEKLRSIWRAASQHPAYRSVMDLLWLHRVGDIQDVRFLDSLTVAGQAISPADVEQARLRSEQGQDTDALQDAQKFLGAVKDSCPSPAELHQLVLTTVIEQVTALLGRGKPKLEVREVLTQQGFNLEDASRLVSTLAGSATRGPRLGLDTVRAKLAEGQLDEAQRILTVLSPEPEDLAGHTQLQQQIDQLLTRKRQLLQSYQVAVKARDFPQALTAIVEAMRIDRADDALAHLKDSLPPAAPAAVTLRTENSAVVISWPRGADDGLTFTLVRAAGRAPTTPTDGTVLGRGLNDTSFSDTQAPPATNLGYSVFSSRGGEVFSDACSAQITVLPVPTKLSAATGSDGAVLSWSQPSAAAGVVITQLNAQGQAVESKLPNCSSFNATGLTTGASYRFSVQAVYLLDSGPQRSDAAAINVVPRGAAVAVTDLDISAATADQGGPLRASWTGTDGFDVELWQFPRHLELPVGAWTTQQVRAGGGQRVPALPGSGQRAGQTLQLFQPPTEIVRLATLTVVDAGYLVGSSTLTGAAPQPTDVVAEVFAEDLRLSWVWPAGDYVVELAWEANGRRRTRRVTRARYRADGGVMIVGGATVEHPTIATVVTVEDETWTSAARAISFATDQTHLIHYQLAIKRGITGKVRCLITAESPTMTHTVAATLVLKRGSLMPLSRDDGQAVETVQLSFAPDTAFRHEVEVGKLKSPFWLSLFSDDAGVELIAPPTSQMKG